MSHKQIDLLTAPLKGTALIEANAGTGKTYNITALFTRMVTEEKTHQGLPVPVESILVVTYTKAAVSDLKSKIYKRLNDVLSAMSALENGLDKAFDDPFPMEYAKHRKEHLTEDIKNIKNAIRDFDQCSVFTIHGFCQRMLKENAFSGDVAYDVELTGDSTELIRKPVYNYWRMNVYKAPVAVMPLLTKTDPEGLIKFYKNVQSNQAIEIAEPEKLITSDDILRCEEELTAMLSEIKTCYASSEAELKELMDTSRKDFPLNKKVYRKDLVPKSFEEIESVITNNTIHCPQDTKSIYRFTNECITDNSKDDTVSHIFFDLVSKWYAKELEFQEILKGFDATFKYNLCVYMDGVLEKHKEKQNLQSYDDLIGRMRNAVLDNEGHSSMTSSLHRKFQAALIDEFQDTDPYQYDIFFNVFGRHNKPFFMIGDPKQAIYSFRGADVFAYLKAASAKGNKYTLTENFRSDKGLIEGVNAFFKRENAFMLEQISYIPSVSEKDMKLTVDGSIHPPMTVWECDKQKREEIASSTARHIAELLNKSSLGNANINGEPVKPSDIAVLCRKKDEMIAVKNALSACRVPAVMSGSESVFESDEAKEMASILAAVLSPFSQQMIKTALATTIFGYTAKQIYGITETDEWDDITEEFRGYNDLINLRGFAPMFFSLASKRGLYKNTASMDQGERKLTNMIHITELAQTFEADRKAVPADILKWLKEKIANPKERDDEAELKMDSDENAVTIITIHKSKGLEYNIVYTPFLMYTSGGKDIIPKYHDGDRFIMDLTRSDTSKELHKKEEQAERLRIAYVALTRAKCACFTAWGGVTGHDNSPLAYLINGSYSKFDHSAMHAYFTEQSVDIKALPLPDVQTYTASDSKPEGTNRTFTGEIPQIWQLNSFSRLIHSSSTAKDTDQFTKPATEDISDEMNIFSFPKGAKAGTCLHDCMEAVHFESFTKESVTETVMERLSAYSFDTDYTPAVAGNIYTILNKDMHGTKLSSLKKGEYVAEMEFQMSAKPFTAEALAEIFARHGEEDYAKAASTLSFETVNGFINGFADLIFSQNGRYYVLDWKSNHLGNGTSAYSNERMHAEMLGSHYYLQMYIYTLALDRHLSRYMQGYSYQKHIGGGIYVFMRGVHAEGDEGLYFHRPNEKVIRDMQELTKG
jgi:exodeoxyribonuclease V beta subunit